MRLARALLLAAALAAPAARAQPADPAAALLEAQLLAGRGEAAVALRLLEDWLQGAGPGVPPEIAAPMHLQAAGHALAVPRPETARSHAEAAQDLLPAYASEPVMQARMRRGIAAIYEKLGDPAGAEPLLAGAVEGLAGWSLPAAAAAADALGQQRIELVRPQEAVAAFQRSLELLRQADAAPAAGVRTIANLANAYLEAGQLPAARRAAEEARAGAGTDPRLQHIADYAKALVRLREPDLVGAEALLRAVAEAPEGQELRGQAWMVLANSRFNRGLLPEAVQAAEAAAEAYAVAPGERHPAFARALHALAAAHEQLGDLQTAEAFYLRAARVLRAALGPDSTQLHAVETDRASLLLQRGDVAGAEALARVALTALHARPVPERRWEGLATVVLALAAERRGAGAEAAQLYREAAEAISAARGPYAPEAGVSLLRLGRLQTRLGALEEARVALDRAVDLYARLDGTATVRRADAMTARAELRLQAGDTAGAAADLRTAYVLLRDRADEAEDAPGGLGQIQRRGAREIFAAQARLLLALAPGDPQVREMAFIASQASVTNRAGDALRRAAARLAFGGTETAALLRARENAREALRQTEIKAREALARGDAERPLLLAQLRGAEARLREATARLGQEGAGQRLLGGREAVPLAALQARLAPEEALLAPVAAEEGLLLWVVTCDAAEALSVPIGRARLAELVRQLRGGMTLAALLEPEGPAQRGMEAAARALHKALVTPALPWLVGRRHIVLVPDGPLQALSPHLLLGPTGPADWLARRFAVTIAPSVSAMMAAREAAAHPSAAPLPFLGVGDARFAGWGGAAGLPAPLRAALAALPPLRETEGELRRMAALLGGEAGGAHLLTGADATEEGLMAQRPARFRVMALATHGLMAGEVPGLAEPGLVLTPGGAPPAEGLLTASDIAASVELDADLVVLSACNTAAPEEEAPDGGAEGLSGLARAFLHAGARALLVSHWAVESHATTRLTTDFFEAWQQAPGGRPAEALQSAMLRMLGSGDPLLDHPVFWAGFVAVGG